MTITLELGGFKLEHRPTRHQAGVRVTVDISSAQDNLQGFDDHTGLLERLLAVDSWIARTQHFALVLQVYGLASDRTEILTEVIQQAKLWRQLNLEVDSREIRQDGQATTFSFLVRHHEHDTGSIRKRPHKLSVDESSSDLRPPATIAALKADRLLLQILLGNRQVDDSATGAQHGHSCHSSNDCDDIIADDDPDDDWMLDEASDLDVNSGQPSRSSTAATHGRPSPESSYMICEHDSEVLHNQDRKQCSLVPFLDAALRYAIISRPKRLHRGIRIGVDERLATLQEISPAIWSPGYLNAMTERACFIPTINRALHVALRTRTNCSAPSEKFRRLQDGQPHEPQTSQSLAMDPDFDTSPRSQGPSDPATIWKKLHLASSHRARQTSLLPLNTVQDEGLLEDEEPESILYAASDERTPTAYLKGAVRAYKQVDKTEVLMPVHVVGPEDVMLEADDLMDDLADEDLAILVADSSDLIVKPNSGVMEQDPGDLPVETFMQDDEPLLVAHSASAFSWSQTNWITSSNDDDILSDTSQEILEYEEDEILSSQSSFTSYGSAGEERSQSQAYQTPRDPLRPLPRSAQKALHEYALDMVVDEDEICCS